VTVIAASPAKKSAVVPGPGIPRSTKIALCSAVIASTIGCWSNAHDLPSGLQGCAPQPVQNVARLSHPLKSKSRMTSPALPVAWRTFALAASTDCQFQFPAARSCVADGCPALFSRSVLTNTPNGELENG